VTLRMVIDGAGPHILVEEEALIAIMDLARRMLKIYDEQRARVLEFERLNQAEGTRSDAEPPPPPPQRRGRRR
jgi:hypothetical protein